MRPTTVLVLLLCCSESAARAGDVSAGYADCGGDAFSNAQVVERRASRHGPLTAVPQTLCVDLAPQRPPASVHIVAGPFLAPQVGPSALPAPYDGKLPPAGRPLRSPNP